LTFFDEGFLVFFSSGLSSSPSEAEDSSLAEVGADFFLFLSLVGLEVEAAGGAGEGALEETT